ncbi:MAG: restriction endonuclease subunit S [Gallionella sp.]|nr:restriction endonuclease subunit S [Gallionella sp.]
MSSEQTRSLRDFVSLQRGTTYKGNLVGLPGPVLLGLASIKPNGGFRYGGFKTYGGECPEKISLRSGDLYVSLKDVTQSGDLLGSVAKIPTDIESGRLTQDTVKLVFDGAPTSKDYLYWLLRTPAYRDYCRGCATGTTTLGLARDDFLNYPVPNPSEADMVLVELLEGIEKRITLLSETNATLEAIAQAMFKSWFVDFDPVHAKQQGLAPEGMSEAIPARGTPVCAPGVPPDPSAAAALFPDSFEESELGLVPRGWRTSAVYDLAQYINGAAYKAFEPNAEQRGLPIIKIAELKAGVTKQTGYSDVSMPEKYRIATGDILFSWSGNPDTSIDTFVWLHGDAWLNQHIFRVVPSTSSDRSFVLMTLKYLNPIFAEIARNKQTTGLGHVTVADLKRLRVVKPSDAVLQQWNEIVDPLIERALNVQQQAQTLATLRDTLLPRLIAGKISISGQEGVV